MRGLFLGGVLLFSMGVAAPAATLTVNVRGADGKPVRDAVVTLHLVDRATPAPQPGSGYGVEQKDLQFHPFVLVVPVGAQVAFPNLDAVRHHVYSFSPTKRFELKLYAREQNRTVRFDKAGIVPLGCNIHDQMTAFVDVVDTVWAGKTDASGNVVIGGVPAGQVSVTVWHPYLRAPANSVSRAIAMIGDGARASFAVQLRPPPRVDGAGY